MVSTADDRFSQAYGRFEFRARVSPAQSPGLHSALWLYPASLRYGPWPASGEIDVAEMYSLHPDRAIPFIHYNAAGSDPTVTNNDCLISDLADFHRYVAEWTPAGIKIYYDGQLCLQHAFNPVAPLSAPQPFDQPFYVVLTQALGVGTNAFDPASTPLPATTEIDYVRVWK
jgi:beta-glucanase (GH16 family)